MKFLVIGLGSMGKRRVRCLKALGYSDITGFDPRGERCNEAVSKYSIKTVSDIPDTGLKDFDAIIISTPPDLHTFYAKKAINQGIPVFIEASVILDEVKDLNSYNKNRVFVAPSCTLIFHPLIKNIASIVNSGEYGEVTNFSYHSGQYLPDWHPWESIKDFYVSNRITGGAREIVPFELTWITDIFGLPLTAKGYFAKTMPLDADIETTYSASLQYDGFLGSIIVDIVSRFATRSFILNFEKAQLRWNWEDNFIRLYKPENDKWNNLHNFKGKAAGGYNKNIVEEMYIDEINAFIRGISDPSTYPNNLEKDIEVLKVLKEIEDSDHGFEKRL